MNGMLSEIKKLKPLSKAYFIVMVLLVCSIVINNAMNSICIMMLLAVWLVERGFGCKWKQLLREPFFILNALSLVLYAISIGISHDKGSAIFFFTKNLSLIIIPTVLLSGREFNKAQINLILKAFILCVFIAMSIESLLSLIQYFETHDRSFFFYHKLVGSIDIGGAIIASFFCMTSMVFLFYLPDKGRLKWFLYAAFGVWIILLNSKMFLATLLLLFLINGFSLLTTRVKIVSILIIASGVLFLSVINNPIKQRFMDMSHFQKSYLTASTFNPDMYFDGLSLRVIYIRFGLEIMRENGNYLIGVGSGDAENLLKKKIASYNMYTGDGVTEKEGYLKYGYHNEYLQRLVQFGFAGFSLFMAAIVYCFYMAIKYKQKLLLSLMIIFSSSFFTDTLIEHQVGLVSFLVFSCLCIIIIRDDQIKRQANMERYSATDFIKAL